MQIKDKEIVINPYYTYSKSEYSRRFAVSRVTVDKMIKEGDLKAIHVHGAVLVTIK